MTSPFTYIPFMFSATTPEDMQLHFDGPLPKVGDAIELVCYQVSETDICCKWRVAQKPNTEAA